MDHGKRISTQGSVQFWHVVFATRKAQSANPSQPTAFILVFELAKLMPGAYRQSDAAQQGANGARLRNMASREGGENNCIKLPRSWSGLHPADITNESTEEPYTISCSDRFHPPDFLRPVMQLTHAVQPHLWEKPE
jgi:hypothetical protein